MQWLAGVSDLSWLVILLVLQAIAVRSQILSASFTPCLPNAQQAPSAQLLNISLVYAQLDRSAVDGSGKNAGQALLRLVALADTGVQATGFSNVTNFLATLIVDTSLLSFLPYSNQTSLCSSILTAGSGASENNETASSYPAPGGCPYGPGQVIIGYDVPLGSLGDQDYLSTLSTRLRILDTSVPPLQLACVDVYTTPYYTDSTSKSTRDASSKIYNLILWLPVAIFVSYVILAVAARLYSAYTTARQERETALATSLTAKLSSLPFMERMKEILFEMAVGRSIVRSRSLTRFVTPRVGDVLGALQFMALLGMCSVQWQGYAYPILSKVGWSMLLFNTTLVSDHTRHTDPSASISSYPPASFQSNAANLFTTITSPFYFSSEKASNLLNLPSTSSYNRSSVATSIIYPTVDETQGIASFAWVIGLQPQNLFANSLVFFAILLAFTMVVALLLPVMALFSIKMFGRGRQYQQPALISRSSTQDDISAQDDRRTRHSTSTGGRDVSAISGPIGGGLNSSDGDRSEDVMRQLEISVSSSKHETESYSEHVAANAPRRGNGHGINRWWVGNEKERDSTNEEVFEGRGNDQIRRDSSNKRAITSFGNSPYDNVASWVAFCQGFVSRIIIFFHLPITVLSVYQLAHATHSSSTTSVVFAAFVFSILSLAIPVYLVFRIRRTQTRYLQDDTNTLLRYGPIYNTYAQDSYTFSAVRFMANLIEGCAVGGAQSRATVQVAIILVVEIAETLITSIWLPWGEGAAQGALQFILSVSRIISAVLLIVISPSVRLSVTAQGWIGYVIILIQVIVITILLLVLLSKVLELAVRMVGGVEFDESRSSKVGGLLGAFRKTGLLGSRRQRIVNKTYETSRKNPQGMKQDMTQPTNPMSRMRQVSASGKSESGFLSPGNGVARSAMYPNEDEDEGGYIMSAWQSSRPASSYDPGYVQPGSYSALQGQARSGFSKIRGGRATDEDPYTLQKFGLPPGAIARPSYNKNNLPNASPPGPPIRPNSFLAETARQDRSETRRMRAASQSAIIEEFQNSDTQRRISRSNFQSSNRDDRRMSAPLSTTSRVPSPQMSRRPTSSGTPQDWKRESSVASGFFSNLFRGNTSTQEGDPAEWTDSDDSEAEALVTARRKWPFNRKTRKASKEAVTMTDMQKTEGKGEYAVDEEDGWDEQYAEDGGNVLDTSTGAMDGRSFVVVRPPPPW